MAQMADMSQLMAALAAKRQAQPQVISGGQEIASAQPTVDVSQLPAAPTAQPQAQYYRPNPNAGAGKRAQLESELLRYTEPDQPLQSAGISKQLEFQRGERERIQGQSGGRDFFDAFSAGLPDEGVVGAFKGGYQARRKATQTREGELSKIGKTEADLLADQAVSEAYGARGKRIGEQFEPMIERSSQEAAFDEQNKAIMDQQAAIWRGDDRALSKQERMLRIDRMLNPGNYPDLEQIMSGRNLSQENTQSLIDKRGTSDLTPTSDMKEQFWEAIQKSKGKAIQPPSGPRPAMKDGWFSNDDTAGAEYDKQAAAASDWQKYEAIEQDFRQNFPKYFGSQTDEIPPPPDQTGQPGPPTVQDEVDMASPPTAQEEARMINLMQNPAIAQKNLSRQDLLRAVRAEAASMKHGGM